MLKDNEVAIGRVARPFGIKGDIKLTVMTDFPERFDAVNTVSFRIDADTVKRYEIERCEGTGAGLTLHLKGIDDRNASEALAG